MTIDAADIKTLKVNDRELAKYFIQGATIFIKALPPYIIASNVGKSEEYCIQLISLVENITLRQSAYLNV